MAGNLFTVMDTLSTSRNSQGASRGKGMIGYSVSSYKNVYEDLQKARYNITGANIDAAATSGSGMFGVQKSYADVLEPKAEYDSNGFSKDKEIAMWKMQLRLKGGLPVFQTQHSSYSIACLEHQKNQPSNNANQVPLDLQLGAATTQLFDVGCFIDIADLAISYFNTMFCSSGEAGKFDSSSLWKLVANKCICAEVVFPKVKDAGMIGVIGQCNLSNNATLYVNPSIFGCSGWGNKQVSVKVSVNNGENVEVVPTGSKYKFPMQGATYNHAKCSIDKYGKLQYDKWEKNSSTRRGGEILSLIYNDAQPVYVRFFIPTEKKSVADNLGVIPQGCSPNIYRPYGSSTVGGTYMAGALTNEQKEMLQCLAKVCDARGLMPFKIQDFGPNGTVNLNGKYGGNTRQYSATGAKFGGTFTIPKGWPMGIDSDVTNSISNYADVKDKRIDNQLCMTRSTSQDVTDTVLKYAQKEKSWYQAAAAKADTADIIVKCNSSVATKFNTLFAQSFRIYKEAHAMYNASKAEGDRVLIGQFMLKVCPSLCYITEIHRYNGSTSKHCNGQAIDFNYAANYLYTWQRHKQTPFVQGLQIAYRPFFHYLWSQKGIWGGASSTFYKRSKFDGMHISFF